jgi:glutamine cyclotransferase
MAEVVAKDQVTVTLEKARIDDLNEIEQLKADLKQTQLMVQTSQIQIVHQGELIEQLRAKLELVEGQVIDIGIFQSQTIEIRKRVSVAQ